MDIFTKDLPIDEKYPNSCVYWIYHEDKHTDPRKDGYVGVASGGVEARYKKHQYDAAKGSSLVVHRAIRKHGDKIKVKVLLLADPEFCLLVEYALRPLPNMDGSWNIHCGGNLGNLGGKASPETLVKMSEALKGRKLSEDHIAKISSANRGKVRSEEIKEKMSERMLGFKHSEETKVKISKTSTGRKHSKESLKRMSVAQATRQRSDDEIAKIVERNKKGLSVESEGKRQISIRAVRARQPWRNSSIKDHSIWLSAELIEVALADSPGINTNKLATIFATSRDRMETIHTRLLSGWSPSNDAVFQEWLTEYRLKESNETTCTT